MFGHKIDEGMGAWRKLHDGELHNFYSTTDIFRMIKEDRAFSTYVRDMHTHF
jgi:hypothetical protein